jgi:SAM-dependent methyltransferase
VVDGGVLPGVASTVLDLRRFEEGGIDGCRVLRAGAVSDEEIAAAVAGQFHFNPTTYLELIRDDLPAYDEFQTAVVEASGSGAASILELGTGTGETARRLLARNPAASLIGVDESDLMLASAREGLAAAGDGSRVALRIARLQDPLPTGPFALVASALCVHHLTGAEKADLFSRVREVLVAGGRFVLGDVIVPVDPEAAATSLTPGYDKPDTIADQLEWLADAGFDARVVWERGDLVVIVADARRDRHRRRG